MFAGVLVGNSPGRSSDAFAAGSRAHLTEVLHWAKMRAKDALTSKPLSVCSRRNSAR